jgi:hypothetical protein
MMNVKQREVRVTSLTPGSAIRPFDSSVSHWSLPFSRPPSSSLSQTGSPTSPDMDMNVVPGGPMSSIEWRNMCHREPIAALEEGRLFTAYTAMSPIGFSIFIWYKRDPSHSSMGWLLWCKPGQRIETPTCTLPLDTITDIYTGKQTKTLQSEVARDAISDQCFSIVSKSKHLDLEAESPETLASWLSAMNWVVKSAGKEVIASAATAASGTDNSNQHHQHPPLTPGRSLDDRTLLAKILNNTLPSDLSPQLTPAMPSSSSTTTPSSTSSNPPPPPWTPSLARDPFTISSPSRSPSNDDTTAAAVDDGGDSSDEAETAEAEMNRRRPRATSGDDDNDGWMSGQPPPPPLTVTITPPSPLPSNPPSVTTSSLDSKRAPSSDRSAPRTNNEPSILSQSLRELEESARDATSTTRRNEAALTEELRRTRLDVVEKASQIQRLQAVLDEKSQQERNNDDDDNDNDPPTVSSRRPISASSSNVSLSSMRRNPPPPPFPTWLDQVDQHASHQSAPSSSVTTTAQSSTSAALVAAQAEIKRLSDELKRHDNNAAAMVEEQQRHHISIITQTQQELATLRDAYSSLDQEASLLREWRTIAEREIAAVRQVAEAWGVTDWPSFREEKDKEWSHLQHELANAQAQATSAKQQTAHAIATAQAATAAAHAAAAKSSPPQRRLSRKYIHIAFLTTI